MSDTPRTDAVTFQVKVNNGTWAGRIKAVVPAEEMRKLEKELAAEKTALRVAEDRLAVADGRLKDEIALTGRLATQLGAVTAERDRLQDAMADYDRQMLAKFDARAAEYERLRLEFERAKADKGDLDD